MDIVEDYFPSKLATGIAFCNRFKEREELAKKIEKGRHIVIYSPRRYGKTSLINKIILENNLQYTTIDLFLAHNENIINKRILNGISNIISQVLSPTQKTLKMLQQYFQNYKISLGYNKFYIEGIYSNNLVDNVDQIYTSLLALEEVLKSKNKKVIIFFDEFQDISNSKNSKAIQGAIRNIAQNTNNIIFIFSGSYRHMLAELFEKKTQPLYMLCDKIDLERITDLSYKQHLNKISKIKWKQNLEENILKKIIKVTECHAFYINLLCNILFDKTEIIKEEEVLKGWNKCLDNEKRRLISEIEKLSINQQDVLRGIALCNPVEIYGMKFTNEINKAPTTIRQAVSVLLKKDFIVFQQKYKLIDPLLSYYLKTIS